MQLLRQSNSKPVKLDPSKTLGAGGEARVYVVVDDDKLVAKVYRKPSEEQARKLEVMTANPPLDPMAAQGHVSIAWPTDLLVTDDASSRVVGFLMPRAEGTRRIIDFYNPMTRRRECPLFSYLYLLRTARNLAAAVHAVHARGYVIGDVNESNILVTDTSLVTLVDTDSFQVRDPQTSAVFRCRVGKPEFTPPELQKEAFRHIDRSPEHDRFGLTVLIFQLLMEGTHPFAGVYGEPGDPPPYAARIAAGHFPYGSKSVPYRPMPVAPAFDSLPRRLQELFVKCFEDGHIDPSARPDAEAWVNALQDAEGDLSTCRSNSQHRYSSHLSTCPWCERRRQLGGRDPFPTRAAVLYGEHLKGPEPSQSALPTAASPAVAPPPPLVLGPQPATSSVAPPASPDLLAPAQSPVPTPVPAPIRKPGITTASRRPQPPARPRRWPVLAVGAVLAIILFIFGGAQARRIGLDREVQKANALIAEVSRIARPDGKAASSTPEGLTDIRTRKEKAAAALQAAHRVLEANPGYPPAVSAEKSAEQAESLADADTDAENARKLVIEITDSIERYKNRSLTDRQAEQIRNDLRTKCKAAVDAADQTIKLDPNNYLGWIEKVRALRLMADDTRAKLALQQALDLFPGDDELLKLQALLNG